MVTARLVRKVDGENGMSARIAYDADLEEYQVTPYRNGVRGRDEEVYYTDDRDDAMGTAYAMCGVDLD